MGCARLRREAGVCPLAVARERAAEEVVEAADSVALAAFRTRVLPDAMANALALLGWGPPDEVEIRPMAEIVELFSLETVNKAAAMFDVQKLGHINAEYIKALSAAEFTAAAEPWLTSDEAPWPADAYDSAVVEALALSPAAHFEARRGRRLVDLAVRAPDRVRREVVVQGHGEGPGCRSRARRGDRRPRR